MIDSILGGIRGTHRLGLAPIDQVFHPDMRVAILEGRPQELTPFLRSMGVMTPDEYVRLEEIRRSRCFLVHNGSTEMAPAKCTRCGHRHPYFTWFCRERPFRGLRDALMAYVKVRNDPKGIRVLNQLPLPDLEREHPRTARELRPGDTGEDAIGFALGKVEPISAAKAEELAERIRMRDPRWTY